MAVIGASAPTISHTQLLWILQDCSHSPSQPVSPALFPSSIHSLSAAVLPVFQTTLQFFESIHSLYCFWTDQVIVSPTDFVTLLLQPSSNKWVNNKNLRHFADVQIQTSVSFYYRRLG